MGSIFVVSGVVLAAMKEGKKGSRNFFWSMKELLSWTKSEST
jgi:hypothetical protein